MRCELGQTWTGRTCTGESDKYEWQEALDEAKTISYVTYSDWRVPTIKELQSLIYCSNGKRILYIENGFSAKKSEGGYDCESGSRGMYKRPTIAQQVFPNATASVVWSSSPLANYSYVALGVYFYSGYSDNYSRSNDLYRSKLKYVRLVRSRQ